MIDILVYLFENYADFADQPQPEALARKLNALGFPENDISRALLWLTELQHAPREVTPPAATRCASTPHKSMPSSAKTPSPSWPFWKRPASSMPGCAS